LVNLIEEIESRMVGTAVGQGLQPGTSASIPEARTYVLVLFDGLGVAQLGHEAARSFRDTWSSTLDAPFPTTTSVSLASLATGLPPSRHGLTSHLVWLEETGLVVNTLKWVDLTGKPVPYDYSGLLPAPNVWERLRRRGIEPITVQPAPFAGSPLSRLLYRGARFESAWGEQDLIDATVQLAGQPNRFIFTYVWQIDFAGHVSGLESAEFGAAMGLASRVWEELASRLPPGVTLIGTADHGLIEYAEESKILVRQPEFASLRYAGDPRGVQVWGAPSLLEHLAAVTGGELVDPLSLLGPDPTPETRRRVGDSLLIAPEGRVILPPGFDKRLRAYHGGLVPDEREIPLLIA
jgi:hypothetical protein